MTDVVIPAHNEAPRIAPVLEAVGGASGVGRIIVVADRCTDDTAEVARWAGADVILSTRCGDKGHALAAGLAAASSARVLLCDADIEGLAPEHVERLLGELVPGQAAGLFDYGAALNPLLGRLPPITGQRVIPRELALRARLDGYRAELALNAAVGAARLPSVHLVLPGVENRRRPRADVAGMVADLVLYGATLAADLMAYAVRSRLVN